jgi:hypothetical protein
VTGNGASVLAGGHLRVRLPQFSYRGAGVGLRGDVLFGVGYGTASLSCTLPIKPKVEQKA